MISHENPNFPYDIHPLFVIHFEIISLFPYSHSVGDNKGIASRLSRSMDQVKSLITIYIYGLYQKHSKAIIKVIEINIPSGMLT